MFELICLFFYSVILWLLSVLYLLCLLLSVFYLSFKKILFWYVGRTKFFFQWLPFTYITFFSTFNPSHFITYPFTICMSTLNDILCFTHYPYNRDFIVCSSLSSLPIISVAFFKLSELVYTPFFFHEPSLVFNSTVKYVNSSLNSLVLLLKFLLSSLD